ncbi:MAG: epoxyqueuosine reductase [Anaerolineae bacterium]|nr:epoxyqueuosine reductase [Chloroflexota bacterium]
MPQDATALSQWIRQVVTELAGGPGNAMQGNLSEPAWDPPLVAFARGDDSIFETFKQTVDPAHWTPLQALMMAHPDLEAEPSEVAVISWVLPQTEATRGDNRTETVYPSERWARSRMFGEAFNTSLKDQVVAALEDAGYPAACPTLLPAFHTVDSERFVIASLWSERHIAHACGLGTFGLCDGLITPAGKAHRLGSVVARMPIPPASRPYSDPHAYCLYYSRGTCGVCITRCPVGAISEQGHDKRLCQAHLNTTRAVVRERFGFDGYACGLCQTGVPCEAGIPPTD